MQSSTTIREGGSVARSYDRKCVEIHSIFLEEVFEMSR